MAEKDNQLIAAISRIMGKVGSIVKTGTNEGEQAWKYATIEDVLSKIQPMLAEEGIVILQDEHERNFWGDEGEVLAITYAFALHHKSGETICEMEPYRWAAYRQTGTCLFKTADGYDDKAANKCHTAARKYFLLALFQIPTRMEEADKEAKKASPKPKPAYQKALKTAMEKPIPAKAFSEWQAPQAIGFDYATMTIAQWAEQFAAALRYAQSDAEQESWWLNNSAVTDEMTRSAPDLFDRLTAYDKKLRAERQKAA